MLPKKSLGQHWLKDQASVAKIVEVAELDSTDTVVEIGPGQGVLTVELIKHARNIIAIEIDSNLAGGLTKRFSLNKNLQIVNQDFLEFDLSSLEVDYKIVANIPYFLTGKIIRKVLNTKHKPKTIVLLLQKEVGQRLAAKAGKTSIITVLTSHYYQVELSDIIEAVHFDPPPNVDSQIVVMKKIVRPNEVDFKLFSQVVRAGFSSRRKKLSNCLSAVFRLEKAEIENLLTLAKIDPLARAQELSMDDWYNLTNVIAENIDTDVYDKVT